LSVVGDIIVLSILFCFINCGFVVSRALYRIKNGAPMVDTRLAPLFSSSFFHDGGDINARVAAARIRNDNRALSAQLRRIRAQPSASLALVGLLPRK